MSSRKDDPVFNVKFVQLVESKPCLWNSTLPEYSKKDEIQKAWQEVANETKDTALKKTEWTAVLTVYLLDLWEENVDGLRGVRKYTHIYKEMGEKLGVSGAEVKNKVDNLTKKYRKEQVVVGPSGGAPSTWEHYERVNKILATSKAINYKRVMVESTVRNCRERWRTIRSSFLRSLKLSRTSTGRGKRKYYLSKYLQFLIPYTKTRLKNSASIIAQRKAAAAGNIPPMTRISNMPIVSSDDTKDSTNSAADITAIAEGDVVVSLHEGAVVGGISITQHAPLPLPQPLNLQAIKQEKDVLSGGGINTCSSLATCTTTLPSASDTQRPYINTLATGCLNNISGSMTSNSINCNPVSNTPVSNKMPNTNPPPPNSTFPQPADIRNGSTVDLTEFAEWIKTKSEHHRHCVVTRSPDADQSFLNSLHPFLQEMSGKQNRRFRQKVVALIDAILDNAD